jgi:hypothetical protein
MNNRHPDYYKPMSNHTQAVFTYLNELDIDYNPAVIVNEMHYLALDDRKKEMYIKIKNKKILATHVPWCDNNMFFEPYYLLCLDIQAVKY